MNKNLKEFLEHIKQLGLQLNQHDYKCLHSALSQHNGIEKLYCMPKVHKDKMPVPLRPVVATINTTMCAIGKLVAHWLSPITKQVDTFIRDSDHLIKKLHEIGEMQLNEYLFTTDAIATCPNIDVEEDTPATLLSFEINIANYNTESIPMK